MDCLQNITIQIFQDENLYVNVIQAQTYGTWTQVVWNLSNYLQTNVLQMYRDGIKKCFC